ncbi:Thylakoid lumenal 17-protein [Nymphaea thermarum]|nr:Thylakoid lumenal 17-protein [Nymphaea thermarum]
MAPRRKSLSSLENSNFNGCLSRFKNQAFLLFHSNLGGRRSVFIVLAFFFGYPISDLFEFEPSHDLHSLLPSPESAIRSRRWIRPCPSMNPGCISTNPKSSSFAFPWIIAQTDAGSALQKIEDAIRKTQGNPKIRARESTPYGQYLQAEVDGGLGRDMLEFLVKEDVVAYRCMATKVTYIYPFTTAFGDSKGQHERLKKISDVLGWYAPDFETMNE